MHPGRPAAVSCRCPSWRLALSPACVRAWALAGWCFVCPRALLSLVRGPASVARTRAAAAPACLSLASTALSRATVRRRDGSSGDAVGDVTWLPLHILATARKVPLYRLLTPKLLDLADLGALLGPLLPHTSQTWGAGPLLTAGNDPAPA